ncbi:phosphatase PAP2 family protein [Sediminibacterium soli]|uniref:phosphatase PAP2 family protein n=1 Tax=Sediminibacterium soli TaxID=2698829 RepID=UPI001379C7C1|nr:phosphatase PAP2 family protein [Sediminibacterium soli]NCI47966.1 phosphatase PAP2 family protein [Sediminibacterium soli]
MREQRPYAYGNFRTGAILAGITGIGLIVLSFLLTKRELFLAMNHDLGRFADYLFTLFTHLGDGTVWVPVALLVFIYRRDKFPLVFCTVVIGTIIVQSLKNVFIPAQVRPGTLITDHSLFHSVEWVPLLTNFSFPSGHTTTAFSIFLLSCLLIHKKWIVPVGFVYACLVAHSRVYLAEHFPLDIGGGMLTALVTLWISILLQRKWDNRRRKP